MKERHVIDGVSSLSKKLRPHPQQKGAVEADPKSGRASERAWRRETRRDAGCEETLSRKRQEVGGFLNVVAREEEDRRQGEHAGENGRLDGSPLNGEERFAPAVTCRLTHRCPEGAAGNGNFIGGLIVNFHRSALTAEIAPRKIGRCWGVGVQRQIYALFTEDHIHDSIRTVSIFSKMRVVAVVVRFVALEICAVDTKSCYSLLLLPPAGMRECFY